VKLLLISWYFPPHNDIGAVRTGRFAEYLHRSGHDVWVITGKREQGDQSLPCALPEERILRVAWFDVDRLSPTGSAGTPQSAAVSRSSAEMPLGDSGRLHALRELASRHYAAAIRIPDRQIGWLSHLVRAGQKLHESEPFDVIYASGPSFTAFLGAARLSRRLGIPWFAEYRDPWSRDAYRHLPEWRGPIDALMERRTVRRAAGIVAVSEPWANIYRERFGKPAIAIYNGFDSIPDGDRNAAESASGGPLSIVYVGSLYGGLRDPAPLYEAIKLAGLGAQDLCVRFYGPGEEEVFPTATQSGVGGFLSVGKRVGFRESQEIQRRADVLLLLQAPVDPGNVPAKVFEYLGAARPILGMGLDAGVPAQWINQRGAGLYTSDPGRIAAQLRVWAEAKKATGRLASVPESARAGLSREEQFGRLVRFLESTLSRRNLEV